MELAKNLSTSDITLASFNSSTIVGTMICSTGFSTYSEFRVYRSTDDLSSTQWILYLKMNYYSGHGTFEISASRNSNTVQTFVFEYVPVALSALPTTSYIIPTVNFNYEPGLVKTKTLKLAAQQEMTYTTMVASTSTQVGYIISATSTTTTAITTTLSNYLFFSTTYRSISI